MTPDHLDPISRTDRRDRPYDRVLNAAATRDDSTMTRPSCSPPIVPGLSRADGQMRSARQGTIGATFLRRAARMVTPTATTFEVGRSSVSPSGRRARGATVSTCRATAQLEPPRVLPGARELLRDDTRRRAPGGELCIGHLATDQEVLRSAPGQGAMPLIGCLWASAGREPASPYAYTLPAESTSQ